MATPAFPTIRSVSAQPDYKLSVTWDRGSRATIDFKKVIEEGGVFASLKNIDVFNKVKLGERNRTIVWPEPADDLGYPIIDIDAESLAAMSSEQGKESLFNAISKAVKSEASKSKPSARRTS